MTRPSHNPSVKVEPKIATIENHLLSDLLPYGSVMLASGTILMALISNHLERWVLKKLYGSVYQALENSENERRRRSFTYFHVGTITMIALFCVGVYPVIYFLVGRARFSSPPGRGTTVTVGDILLLLAEIYSAYYLFELCFRTKFASPISIAHHLGLLIITQTALALFANLHEHRDATLEFYMCMVWGSFDVVAELPVFVSMIIWRVRRQDHRLLTFMAHGCFLWVVVAAIVETAATMYLLIRSWARWGLVWRTVTPLIFSLWIITQLYGASRFMRMARAEKRKWKNDTPSSEADEAGDKRECEL
ncbi:hypothetical protein B0J15DRAFT_404728 [Fusarium solani]|uniref:TLC domain-containing protein n=2 Tax=Fusarium solani TaxID=169388 RepID=A0A9P9GPM7_FUSSL|nr:uncharacterized protein B0J15DRAFT_404728 [Fusarium solani]KAH7242841.1 hypothetical protein B0J15DRAFT_404728 [Fusarium solani]